MSLVSEVVLSGPQVAVLRRAAGNPDQPGVLYDGEWMTGSERTATRALIRKGMLRVGGTAGRYVITNRGREWLAEHPLEEI